MEPPLEIDPEKMGGIPVFPHSRVPVRSLFEYLEGGYTVQEFLESFPGVTREQVNSVLRFVASRGIPGKASVEGTD